MKKVRCVFNNVNGENTGVYCRTGMGKSYKSPGILVKKNCPNGEFYFDGDDGGTNNYYALIDPQNYGLPNQKMYVYINKSFLATIEWPAEATNTTEENKAPATQEVAEISSEDVTSYKYSSGLEAQIVALLTAQKDRANKFANDFRIFGAPFQFTSMTDYRPYDNIDIGRKYIENILAEAPIVHFVPGVPSYLPDFSEANKDVIKNYVEAQKTFDEGYEAATIIENVNNMEGRYFDFVANYAEYMRYVNVLCRVSAIYLGIGDRIVPGTTEEYKTYDWSRYTNYKDSSSKTKAKNIWETIETAVKDSIFGDYRYLKCYVDPSSSFNESSTNGTTASQIAGIFDTVSGLAKEINFLTASEGTSNIADSLSGAVDKLTSAFSLDDSTNNLARIIGGANSVISGSNIIFPELWSDSNYSKSYDFTINLVSPYGDVESVYLNVIAPMMHLIALGLPRQTSANSFTSPFLVKVFSKGWFTCEMGIVTSLSIQKGGQTDAWNVAGLPTQATVSMTITDLYPNLSIAKSSEPHRFFHNQGLIEFLAVTCGMDLTQPNIVTKIQAVFSTYLNLVMDIPTNYFNNLYNNLRNVLEPLYSLGLK